MIQKSWFEFFVAFLVVSNGIVIGIQTDFLAKTRAMEDIPLTYGIIDKVFCVMFSAELSLRLYVYRCKFFTDVNWKWNGFDFFVVFLQLVEEIMGVSAAAMGETTESSRSSQRFNYLRIMRILRLVRIVRLVRILRLVTELKTIVDSIVGSMRSLMWTLVLLMLLIYMIGVYFTQTVAEHMGSVIFDDELHPLDADLQKYFGTLIRTLLTLYQSMTGGVDWDGIATPLIQRISPLMGVLFSMYIAFSVLAFMNVITGVFVETAMHHAKDQQDHDLMNHARDLFAKCDEGGSGKLTWETFHCQLQMPEMESYFRMLDVDTREAEDLFRLLDIDESGEIDYEEFLEGCMRLRGNARAIDIVTVMIESRKLSRKWNQHARTVESDLILIQDMLDSAETGYVSTGSGTRDISEGAAFGRVDSLKSSGGTKEERRDSKKKKVHGRDSTSRDAVPLHRRDTAGF